MKICQNKDCFDCCWGAVMIGLFMFYLLFLFQKANGFSVKNSPIPQGTILSFYAWVFYCLYENCPDFSNFVSFSLVGKCRCPRQSL